MSYSADSLDEVPSYYVSASAMAYNSFTYQGRPETGEITKTFGSLWVKNENVVPGVNAYPE